MVATRAREFTLPADLLDEVDHRADIIGVSADQLIAELVKQGLDNREPSRETHSGIRHVRRSKTGKKVTAEDVIRLWEELD